MSRVLLGLTAVLLLWPWLISIVLAGLSFVMPLSIVETAWAVPLWTVPFLPVGVAALVLMMSYERTFAAPTGPGSS